MQRSKIREAYNRLVAQWMTIVDQPISSEEKQPACMVLLREFIDSIASTRVRGANRPLRFHADMLVLEELLRPGLGGDELFHVAIIPGYKLVKEWIDQHSAA
jgi:hypothetical protein